MAKSKVNGSVPPVEDVTPPTSLGRTKKRFKVEREGCHHSGKIIEASNAEEAWDKYKAAGGKRRYLGDKAPVITELE